MLIDPAWTALFDPGRANDLFAEAAAIGPLRCGATWHAATAWHMAELSRASYRRRGLSAVLDAAGWQTRHRVEVDGTLALLLHRSADPKCSVLVFRGTASLRDWWINARAVRRSWRGPGRVHYGFRRALLRVWDQLAPQLGALPATTFFTGHSLGGALATLAATLHPPLATYTFGAPRVGDRCFVDALPPGVHRVVNGRDVVPELPPSPRGRYVHGGVVHLLGPPARNADSCRDLDAVRQQLGAPQSSLAPHAALADHAPAAYVARLRQLAAT